MTPEQRRAKHPLGPITPLNTLQLAEIKAATYDWLERPLFTERVLDRHYQLVARLIATIESKDG